jgi:hypothetical protein
MWNDSKERTGAQARKSNGQRDDAEAFLNLTITDSNGVVHKINGGIPLRMDNQLHRSLIEATRKDPEMLFNSLQGSVHIVVKDDGTEYTF